MTEGDRTESAGAHPRSVDSGRSELPAPNGRRAIDRRSDRKLNALMNWIMTKDTKVIDMA